MSEQKMPKWEKWLFAAGDIYGGGAQSILAVIYLIFLTNVLHINPFWAGAVVLVSKGWDAIADPLMGVISDNTRSKLGRRRPYLLAGGFLVIVAFALIWFPVAFASEAGKIAFVMVVYLFYNTVATVISVPYSSMSTEVTTDFGECNKVNLIRLVFSTVSTAICTLVPSLLFNMLDKGSLPIWQFYGILVAGFGTVFAVPLILIGLLGRERVPYPAEKAAFSFKTLIKPFRIRSYRKLLALYLSQALTLDIVSAVILYYTLYVIKAMDSTVFLGTFLGVQLLAFPYINSIVNRVSKTKIYRFGLPLAVVGSLCIAFYPSSFPIWGIYLATGLTALGFAGAQMMSWIIFPDVVDIGEMGLGERITGSFSGVMTFCRKASSALAIFVVGIVLSATGFITPTDAVPHPLQPTTAMFGIRLFVFIPFVLLMGFAWFVARKFRLTPQVSERVKYFNEKLRSGRLDSLDDDEKKEYVQLCKEFVGETPILVDDFEKVRRLCDDLVKRREPKMRWMWGEALFGYALSELDAYRGTDAYTPFLQGFCDYYVQNPPRVDYSDTCAPALITYAIQKKTGNPQYAKLTDRVLDFIHHEPRLIGEAVNHLGHSPESKGYPQSIWVDSLMMFSVFPARYAAENGDRELLDYAARQPALYSRYLQDPKDNLWAHSYWAKRGKPYPRHIYWGRGNGWAVCALPMILQFIGEDHPARAEILGILDRTVRAVLACQRRDGTFPTVLGRSTYRELSATALISAGIMQGVRCGYLPKEFLEPAVKAFRAVAGSIREDETGVFLPEISTPTIPLPVAPYLGYVLIPRGRNLPYGVAAAVFAAIEYDKLLKMGLI